MDVDQFRADARAWLADNRQHAPRDYGAILPPDLRDEAVAWQRRLFDAGFAGISWPVEHGGRGLSPDHQAAWIEEATLAAVPPFINMVGVVLAGGTIQLFGTPEQQRDHLRPIITGERVWCQLFSEPDAGSDLAGLGTRATKDGDRWVITGEKTGWVVSGQKTGWVVSGQKTGWVVSGQKTWCSNGRVADWGILLARTDPDAAKHKGISFFLLDMSLSGVEVRPLRQMTGGSEFDEVFLDEVQVPDDCLVGPLHGGWGVAMATLTNERGHIGAMAISLGRRLEGVADVELLTRGRAYQALGRRQGAVASTAASLMKLGITELMFDIAVATADGAGPHAMLAGDHTAALLAAPGGRIAGGTSQIQRNIIGELLLGLPREPR